MAVHSARLKALCGPCTHPHNPQQTADGKPRRAPRENLDGLTAEERVERRKQRARIYSNVARERYDRLQQELEGDVAAMRMFQALVEEAPQMVAVLSTDVHCLVLYANAAFTRQLARPAASLLGRWVGFGVVGIYVVCWGVRV